MIEFVAQRVVGCAEGDLVPHEVDKQGGGRDEENFHERVVDGHEVQEEVRVADKEHQKVDLLRLARQACNHSLRFSTPILTRLARLSLKRFPDVFQPAKTSELRRLRSHWRD